MHGFRNSFHAALWALVLAIGLPSIVLMFGAIRSRQLQSTANPRWAQFAKITGQKVFNSSATDNSRPVPPTPAGIDSEAVRHAAAQTSLTGSITGHSSLEIPVRTCLSETAPPDRHNADDDWGSANIANEDKATPAVEMVRQLEEQMEDVRHCLQQMVEQQRSHQTEGIQKQGRLQNRETETINKLNTLSVSTNDASSYWKPSTARNHANDGDARHSQPHTESSARLKVAEAASHVPAFDESPQSFNGPSSEQIVIHKTVGPDSIERFTVEVHDVDINQFFDKLSEAAPQYSIVPSSSVTGRISLNLHEVRFDTALKAVLKQRGYVLDREGGILIICTEEELKQQLALNKNRNSRHRALDRIPVYREQRPAAPADRTDDRSPSVPVSIHASGIADRPSGTSVRD